MSNTNSSPIGANISMETGCEHAVSHRNRSETNKLLLLVSTILRAVLFR